MITLEQVVPMMAEACPSVASRWADMETDPIHVDDGRRLHYIDAGAISGDLVALHVQGDDSQVARALTVIERLCVEGDDAVRGLAITGYLEGIQNAAASEPACSPGDFVPLLGPESLKLWNELNGFWGRASPHSALPRE